LKLTFYNIWAENRGSATEARRVEAEKKKVHDKGDSL